MSREIAGIDASTGEAAQDKARGAVLKHYLNQSNVPLDRHVRRKQIELAESIAHRVKIYLDTNFWIQLRKANAGAGPAEANHLLQALRRAVASGNAICPLSEGAFIELLKQHDLLTRQRTAALMDELSMGVTLIEPERRMATEIAHFIHDKIGHGPLDPLDNLVWCKVAFVLGVLHPVIEGIAHDLTLALQKGVLDEMWDMSLGQMVETLDPLPVPSFLDFDAIAARLNTDIAAHASELRSFAQAYKAEVRGIVDLIGHIAGEVVHTIGRRQGVIAADEPLALDPFALKQWKNLLALALKKDKAQHDMRSLHLQASLHASHRWNKGRKLDGNDLLDFAHATAALAYCDAFFTERPLCTMIQQNHIGLVSLYGRTVCTSLAEAVRFVDERFS